MLIHHKTITKLERIETAYRKWIYRKVAELPMEICETREHFRREPGKGSKLRWRTMKPGGFWGGSWITAWFRGDFILPSECRGRRVYLTARTGGDSLLFINGKLKGTFDRFHNAVLIGGGKRSGKKYHIALEAYSGHSFPGFGAYDDPIVIDQKSRKFEGVELLLEREEVRAFVYDLMVLRQLSGLLDENSLRRAEILEGLSRVFAMVDAFPTGETEEIWKPKLAAARRIMKPLLDKKNSPTTPWFGMVNHSHMDTAWLWPLAETWRKCARTYSTMLNLMDQYPEAFFIQSAPCHTEKIKTEYPALFKKIQVMAARGRWEPNGAMWVEADTNIPSGESLVRQLLVGQSSTREMFDFTSDTLWLPDTFGFSGALPQLMKGSRVSFLCTTKLSWNDATRFPYDTFRWKGIDGSEVIVHFNIQKDVADPATLIEGWNEIQHKELQDRRLCAIGAGDGGGGPTMECLEIARRITDLEGCPRLRFTTVSDFMKGLQNDLTDLPQWHGELYLETHRGTLTAMGRIKRANRQSEIALHNAELLSTLVLVEKKKSYPSGEFLEIWKDLLTGQFHDILPGTSIREVNIEALETLDSCIKRAGKLSHRALETLFGPEPKKGGNLVVFNPLGWERNGEISLDRVPGNMIPEDESITCQGIETVEGKKKLALSGLSIPPLGYRCLKLKKGSPSSISPFKCGARRIETPFAVVRFDSRGRISSLHDRRSGREIVKSGGRLNRFLLGEDIPLEWDNWDIDPDQELKRKPAGRLVKREIVGDGPLQLRIRFEYEIGGASRILQDVVFHSTTSRIDFETMLDWREERSLLKTGFDIDILSECSRQEIQFGHIERTTHQNDPDDRARFEVSMQKWTDFSETGFGVALLTDSKYGVTARNNDFSLTLMKCGAHPDPESDKGIHFFSYSLLPHSGGFSVPGVVKPAYEFNIAPVSWRSSRQIGEGPGLLKLNAPNVIVETVKGAEKGGGFIVRLYEAEKTGTLVELSFACSLKGVYETNLLEENRREVKLKKNRVKFYMRPFEIKTLLCKI